MHRRWPLLLALCVILLVLASPYLLVQAFTMAAVRMLPGGGRIEAVDFSLDRIVLRNVSTGNGTLSLEQAVIEFRLAELLRGRVQQVHLNGLRIDLPIAGNGGGSPPTPAIPGLPPLLTVAEASLADAALHVAVGEDVIALPFHGSIALSEGRARGRLFFEGPVFNADALVEIGPGLARLRSERGAKVVLDTLPPVVARMVPTPFHNPLKNPLSLDLDGMAGEPLELFLRQSSGALLLGGRFVAVLSSGSGLRASLSADGEVTLSGGDAPPLLNKPLSLEFAGLRMPVAVVDGRLEIRQFATSDEMWEAEANLRLAARDLQAAPIAASAILFDCNGLLRLNGNHLAFVPQAPGRLRAEELVGPHFALNTLDAGIRASAEPLFAIAEMDGEAALRMNAVLGDLNAVAELRLDSGPRQMAIGAKQLSFAGPLDLNEKRKALTFEVLGGSVTLTDVPGRLLDMHARMRISDGVEAKLVSARLHLPGIVPLSLDAYARPTGEASWRLGANLRDAKRRLEIEASGRHVGKTGTGTLNLTVKPIAFSEDGLQPADLIPALADTLTRVAGRLAATGTLRWSEHGLSPEIDLLIQDGAAALGGLSMSRINTVIRLDGLAPLSTPPDQVAAVGLVEAGLPLTDGRMTFQISGSRLTVAAADISLAGGRMSLANAVVDHAAKEQRLEFRVEGVNLAEIVRQIDLEGLEASGALSGRIPAVVSEGRVFINDARLAATAPGLLRYRPATRPAALEGGGQPVEMMLKALDDFRYRTLVLTLDGEAGGDVEALLHIQGSNPALYDGYPLEFNLTLQGKLDTVLQETLAGYQIPDKIRQRMLNFGVP